MAARRFPLAEITKIMLLVVALVAILLTKDMCGKSATNLIDTVAPPVAGDAGTGAVTPAGSPGR